MVGRRPRTHSGDCKVPGPVAPQRLAGVDENGSRAFHKKGTDMTEPPRYDDAGGTARWVKIFGIIALLVALLVVVMLLIGGGGHGPQRHGGAGGGTSISLTVTDLNGSGTPWHK
jgi:hypothetical protein